MPEKRYLVTPGPTPVPPEVLAATAAPMIHHRTPEFRAVLARVFDRLRQVYRTEHGVVLFASAGTGAMESAVANLCSPGDRVLVVSHGFFGERWAAIARAYRCDVDHLRYEWGETPSADDVAARLEESGGAKVVFLTQSDTSTGVVADIRAIAERINGSDALIAVDAISSLAAVPLETDAWGLDAVVTSSHKALMSPAGLAAVAVSPAAVEAARTVTSPRFYFDWERMLEAHAKHDTPFSPAISLVLGLDVFSPDEDRAAVVTAIRVPPDIDSSAIVLAMRDRSGVTVVGGQGELKGKIVRIGHIGYIDVHDIATALTALELALVEAGADVERGAAVSPSP